MRPKGISHDSLILKNDKSWHVIIPITIQFPQLAVNKFETIKASWLANKPKAMPLLQIREIDIIELRGSYSFSLQYTVTLVLSESKISLTNI